MKLKLSEYPNGIVLASAVASLIVVLIMASMSPGVIATVMTEEKIVALTVDDGPDPRFTPRILEILKDHGARATFFVTGDHAEKYPELLKLQLDHGCEIANHSYSHPDLTQITRDKIREEILTTNGIISRYTGENVQWFRPPFSSYDRRVIEEARKQGLKTIMWTCAVETPKTLDPQEMADRIIERVKPGSIIVFHDSRIDRTPTLKSLPIILRELEKEGYRFVTVSELLGSESEATEI